MLKIGGEKFSKQKPFLCINFGESIFFYYLSLLFCPGHVAKSVQLVPAQSVMTWLFIKIKYQIFELNYH